MLTDSQILHLLARCETATGQFLTEIRGNLRSEEWLSAVWELVVMDAAAQTGRIGYEVSTPGGTRPDLFVEICNGKRLWIEVAVTSELSQSPATTSKKHRVFKILEEKAKKAKRAAVEEPIVVCIGTDRVPSVGPSHAPNEVGRDHAVYDFFRKSQRLSAVIIVPVLLRAEVFVGFARDAHPTLFKNLSKALPPEVDLYLQQLNFNRWPYSVWTEPEPRKVRKSLCANIKRIGDASINTSVLDSRGLPAMESRFPSPTWTYCWQFHNLRITKIGDRYWLFDGKEVIDNFPTAEAAVETAADYFQTFPAHVLAPGDIQIDSNQGVPADLAGWKLEV